MRAQLKHVLLDVDFFTNPKIRAMQRRYNVFATLGLIEVYMAMSMATNAVIDNDAILAIFEDLGADDPQAIIDYLLANGLIIKEMNGFSNSRVIKDQESLYKSQQRYKKHKEQTEEKRCENVSETLPLSNHKSESMNIELMNTELNELVLHGSFNTKEIRDALKLCHNRLKQSGRGLDQISLDALCINQGSPERLKSALLHTAGLTKARNVYSAPEKTAQTTNKKPQLSKQQQSAMETLAIIEAEEARENH